MTEQEYSINPGKRIIGRRRVLALGAAALGLGLSAYIFRDRLFESESDLELIRRKYGVIIPTENDADFVLDERRSKYEGYAANTPAVLTEDESRIFKDSLELIPYAGHLAKFLVPYRKDVPSIGGLYVGRDWKAWKWESVGQREIGEDPVIIINLSKDSELDQEDQPQTHFDSSGNERKDEIPAGTIGENIKRAILHEFGHAFDDAVFFQARPLEDYEEERYNSLIVPYADVSAYNPIYQTFAKVNGWKLVPLVEAGLADPRGLEEIRKRNSWPYASPGAWLRDTSIWGEGPFAELPWFEPVKVRLTVYATTAPINETFAEFFMASILCPNYLTDKERGYFDKIHKGLKGNPDAFIREVAKRPELLLE